MATEKISVDEVMLAEDAVVASSEAIEICLERQAPEIERLLGMSLTEPATPEAHEVEDEYEYVTFGEFLSRMGSRVVEAATEHYLFTGILVFMLFGGLMLGLGQANLTIMIFLAFVLFASFSALMLYMRWQDWHEAREKLERAEMLYKAAKDAERRHGKGSKKAQKA